jgi:hypothetical protein
MRPPHRELSTMLARYRPGAVDLRRRVTMAFEEEMPPPASGVRRSLS